MTKLTNPMFMRRALVLAAEGRGSTHPNPMVGAVVVVDGEVVGEGCHATFGGDHAEVVALRDAGSRAKGATLYVTLEPCCVHGKTPPCTDAVLAAGVARVVIAVLDPNPRVAGRGADRLREGGVAVELGVEAGAAARLNAPFFCHQLTGRAHLTVKLATSIDGRIADPSGRSQWITGDESRTEVHRLRAAADVVAVGAGTVAADNPSLTVRHVTGARNPVRLVFDSNARLAPDHTVFSDGGRTVLVTRPGVRAAVAERPGVDHWEVEPRDDETVPSIAATLERCASEGWIDVLVEGGAKLASSCFREQVVSRAMVFMAPMVIGNGRALGWADGIGHGSLDHAEHLNVVDIRRYGRDVMIEFDASPAGRLGAATRAAS